MHLACPTQKQENNFYSVHREKVSNQGLVRLGQIKCEALLERKSSQAIYKGVDMPPKLNRFNVGLFNKVKKTGKRCSTAREHKTYELCS